MSRGGQRQGAGRKSGWKNSKTQTIRVPKIFAAQILEYARQLDSEGGILRVEDGIPETFESETVSESHEVLAVSPGQISIFDVVDSVSESKTTSLNEVALNRYLKLGANQANRMKSRFKGDPQRFIKWSQGREKKLGLPVVGWRYNESTHLYDPVEDSCDDF